jgi:hypothetical protein
MGNIHQPITRYLFNEVLNKDWGMFKDENSVKNLIIKKHGNIIPKTGTTLKVSQYDPGKSANHFLEITKRPIAEGFPFEFGYTFVRKMKNPGVHNDEAFTHQQYYGGFLTAARAMVNGLIADADVLDIENQILAIAKLHTNDPQVVDKCFVNLRRAYVVNDSDNTDASGFTVTLEDGTEVVFATGTTFAAAQMGVQFNALSTVNTKLLAIRIGANKYIITSIDPFYNFSIATPVDATITHRYIYAETNDTDYDVEAQYNQGEATASRINLTVLDATTATTPALDIYVDGVKHTPSTSSTLATFIANINTAVASDHGVYAILQGSTRVYIFAPETLTSFNCVLGDTSTYTIVKESSPQGGYAYLTSDEVFRVFMAKGNHGKLATQKYITQPIDGGIYRKYILTTVYSQDAVGGAAGGSENVTHVVEIYVLLSAALTSKFVQDGSTGRYMDETLPSGADTSLDALIKLLVA